MSTHFYVKRNKFISSVRTYDDDYSFTSEQGIDMTLSGSFLSKRNISLDVSKILLDKYPPIQLENELLLRLANIHKIYKNNIILGNGANGIFHNLIKIFLRKNKNLVVPYFSFAQPEYAATSMKCEVRRVFCKSNHQIDFEGLKYSIDKKTGAIFLCNPNNPTGLYENSSKIITFAKEVKVPVIVSESNIEFSMKKSLLDFDYPNNIIVVRSFSKAYGLAGIRLGYAIIKEPYKSTYLENTTRFEVSTISLHIAINVLKDNTYKENIKKIILERNFLNSKLDEIGIPMLPSFSNTLMSSNGYPISFYSSLKSKGVSVVLIPDITGKIHFRLAIQNHTINQLFINKIKEQYNETFISNKF